MLFLVRLKNRRIFSLRFLCLNCNGHDSGGIFFLFVQESEETWNPCRIPRIVSAEDSPPKAPYIEDEIWEGSPCTKLQEGMLSEINFAQFPREPSAAKSTPLHKGAIEYTFCVSKRSALPYKSTNGDAPRTLKRQERALNRQRDPGTHRRTRLDRP